MMKQAHDVLNDFQRVGLAQLGADYQEAQEQMIHASGELRAAVLEAMADTGVSAYRLSQLTGVTQTTINKWRKLSLGRT